MSNTALSTTYNGAAANLYVVIRNMADNTVWNGTAFETWSNANLATYAVALTDEGGDLYDVAFPTTISAGDYRITYYERAGGSPAITDLLLSTEERHWDGAALSTSSGVSLSAYALTTLDGVKRHMRITVTTYDTLLTELINQVSSEIERICGRRFAARNYRERHNAMGQRGLVLRNFPVQYMSRIGYGAATAMSITYGGSGIRANASVYRDPENPDAGGIRIISVSAVGVATANNLTFAAYPTVSLLAVAINAISGWSATVQVNVPSADLNPTGSEDARGRTAMITYPNFAWDRYTVDYQRAKVRFDRWSGWGVVAHGYAESPLYPARFPVEFQGLLVEYRAGYETIPADVDLVAREMVNDVYYRGTRDGGVQSEKVGDYSVTYTREEQDKVRLRLAMHMDASQLVGGGA